MSSDFSSLGQISAYELLGVEPDATTKEIIEAHRKLIQRNHPDRTGTDRLAQLVNDARRVLTTQRAEYDAWLRRRPSPGATASAPMPEPATPSESFEDPWDQATVSPPPQPTPPRKPQQYPSATAPNYAPAPNYAQSQPPVNIYINTQPPYRNPSSAPPVTRRRRRRHPVLRIIVLLVLVLVGVTFISNLLSRPSSSPAPSKVATPSKVRRPSNVVARTGLTRRAGPVEDRDCAHRARGQIAAYFEAHGCQLLVRSLYTTTQGIRHRRVLIATALVDFKVSAAAKKVAATFATLELTDGTGDFDDLVTQTHRSYPGGPTRFAPNPTYYAKPTGRPGQVLVMKAMWLDGSTTDHDPALTAVLKATVPRVR